MAEVSLRQYVEELFGGEDEILREMRLDAERDGLPTIQVPLELGRILQLLVVMSGARRILEIGSLFGYSAVLMTRALPPDGRLLTLEADPRHADVTRRNARRAGLADRIEVREGPALDSLVSLRGEEFDFIFIDADKTSYPQYLEAALQLSHPGTVIVGDNVWRGGVVTEDSSDEVVQAVARYNTDLARNPRLLSTIVSTRDGGDAASISVVRAEQSA